MYPDWVAAGFILSAVVELTRCELYCTVKETYKIKKAQEKKRELQNQ